MAIRRAGGGDDAFVLDTFGRLHDGTAMVDRQKSGDSAIRPGSSSSLVRNRAFSR